ncbi:MAG: hypothetical protein AAFR98_10990 [Pseudomonadota bacterium]
MIDGLIIWLALVGVATIAMFTFDLLCWVGRLFLKLFGQIVPNPVDDLADFQTDPNQPVARERFK